VTRKGEIRTGSRRRARECALQLLYQLDVEISSATATRVEDSLALFFAHAEPGLRAEAPDAVAYAEKLVLGVHRHLRQLDQAIQKASEHWKLERMARVDRNVLRLGAYELLHEEDVPARVALNEAIEVAKQFGTEESGSFVNGLLDRIAQGINR
jgi:transcription antitermination protein NusB